MCLRNTSCFASTLLASGDARTFLLKTAIQAVFLTQKAPLEFKSPLKTKNAQHEAVHFLLELVERFELSAY